MLTTSYMYIHVRGKEVAISEVLKFDLIENVVWNIHLDGISVIEW